MMRQVNEDRDPPTLNQALPTGLVWSILGRGGLPLKVWCFKWRISLLLVLWIRCGSRHYEIGVRHHRFGCLEGPGPYLWYVEKAGMFLPGLGRAGLGGWAGSMPRLSHFGFRARSLSSVFEARLAACGCASGRVGWCIAGWCGFRCSA